MVDKSIIKKKSISEVNKEFTLNSRLVKNDTNKEFNINMNNKQINNYEKEIQKIDNLVSSQNLNILDSINKIALTNLYKQTSEQNQEKKYSQEEKKIVLSSFSNYLSSLKLFLDDHEFEKKCEKLPIINSHIITKVEKSLASKNMFEPVGIKTNLSELTENQNLKTENEYNISKFYIF